MVIPALGAGKVQLSLISLAGAVERLARLQEYLSPEELQRGNRLLDRDKRDRFLAGRAVLREILAGHLGEDPGSIRLSEGEFGKPHLSDHLEADSITFNVSHTRELLLIAIAAGREVGVDLEQVRQDLSYRTMAERYFSPHEQEDLFSLPASEQIGAFYRCWTRKEAYLKGTGTGFSQPSNGFDMALLPGQPAALLAHRGSPGEVGRWNICDVEVPQGYCAAVAVEGAGEIKLSYGG
jgi:4'-phosphopantetheinyl transferase